jgi:hypothetical protein
MDGLGVDGAAAATLARMSGVPITFRGGPWAGSVRRIDVSVRDEPILRYVKDSSGAIDRSGAYVINPIRLWSDPDGALYAAEWSPTS